MKLIDMVEGALLQEVVSSGFTNLKVLNAAKKTGLLNQQIVTIFQKWDKRGMGRFIKGSRGQPSRFETAPLLFLMKTAEAAGPVSPAVQSLTTLNNVVAVLKDVAAKNPAK